MSQLVRLEGKHSTQNAHSALVMMLMVTMMMMVTMTLMVMMNHGGGLHATKPLQQLCT